MKILYIGSERSDAETAFAAWRGIDKNVAISWAPRLDHVARWLDQNRDLAALIVEAQIVEAQINGAWPLLLKHLRGLAARPAVVVVVPEGTGPHFEALESAADDYVAKNSLFRDLPIVVTRAVARARAHQQSQHASQGVGNTHERVEVTSEQLHDNRSPWKETLEHVGAGCGTLGRRQQPSESTSRQSAATRDVPDVMAVPPCLAAQPDVPRHHPNIDAQLADAMVAKSALERRLADVEASYQQREQLWSVEQAAAVERQAQLDRLIELERAARADLEQKLAHATAALLDAEQRHRAAMTAAAEQLAERQAQYEIGMARAAATWDMVEEQLRAAALEVERARQNHASAAADVDRLTRRESELASRLADAAATHEIFERRLADAETAVEAANARTERERLAAAEQLAERENEHQAQIAEEITKRRSVEDMLAQALNALDDAEKRHASTMTDASAHSRELEDALRMAQQNLASKAADVERLTKREADLSSILADATTSRNNLERRLAATEAAFQDADTRATRERLAASKRAAEREAELDGQVRQERATRAALEQAVADADAALRDERQRHDAALAAAANELAERQGHFDRELSQTVADCDRLAQQLSEAEGALEQVRLAHQSAAADVDRLAQREMDLTSQLADVEATRHTLEGQLADAASAMRRAAERQAELEGQIREERATRDAIEQALADADVARRDAQQQHDAALAAVSYELGDRQAHFDRELAQTVADRDQLAERLSEAEDALDQVRRDHQSAAANVERLLQREADLTSQLADVEAARHTLERQLAEAVSAIAVADERAANERAATEDRRADLEARLAHEIATHDTLKQILAETRSAALEAERLFREEADALRARGLEQEAHFEAQLAQQRLEHESRLAEMTERLHIELREMRNRLEQAQAAAETDIRRLTDERSEAERLLEGARRDFQDTLDRLSSEHANALAALTASVTEREAQLQEQAARYALSLQAAEDARTELREGFEANLAARDREIEQLQEKLTAANQALEVTNCRQEALQAEADQLPQLHKQLDESRAESHRQFQQAGLAMFRCTRDGALTQANRACMRLVGSRTFDELRGAHFAAAVFEAPNDLSWLIERCVSTRAKESIETTWRRKDGGRLFLRLSACASASGVVEIVAEDLTRLRVLEERLGRAHRMEAAGRLASEVAVTCGNMLSDVHQNMQARLMEAAGNAASRRQGEMLLDEVARAAALLRQLAAYGDDQARTPTVVDLNTVIRDLELVLKRVAGDDVEVQLPATSSQLNVDVGTERVERLLVNLASYGRERMPFGGQLRIELGTIVVDRHFAAKHPSVRLGLHALITVTVIRRAARADGALQVRDDSRGNNPHRGAPQRPGVDFGALQGLVGECGGHLWMTVQPLGDMIAKIRLPLLTSHEQKHPRTPAAGGGRERTITRWFQH